MSKVWFITGTSTGFGRELAIAALDAGNKVVATARKPDVYYNRGTCPIIRLYF